MVIKQNNRHKLRVQYLARISVM